VTLQEQLLGVLRSRKFWATVLSLAGTAVAYSYGKIDSQTAVLAGIAALGAYCVGTGLEGPRIPPPPPNAPAPKA